MALVITLIMLSVTLVMAVAFLAVARRERGAVTTSTDTGTARLAASTALAGAQAQIVANILTTNAAAYNFGLLVSTNFINPNGFVAGNTNLENVSYQYPNGNFVVGDDLIQNVANLWFLPRAPVMLNSSNAMSGRFYLDLNRNGTNEPNGWVTNVDASSKVLLDANGNPVVTFQVGDPEWIGILERPDQPHGPNNHFTARYAFFAQPIGNSLDLNAIHNQAHRGLPTLPANSTVNPPAGVGGSHSDSFIRNESVGSWEINFAAFLADLNTNFWGQVIGNGDNGNTTYYYYNFNNTAFNQGNAFDNAREVLAYRYNNDFNSLSPAAKVFPVTATVFGNKHFDGYTYGSPLLTDFVLPGDNDFTLFNNNAPWVGADNPNRFFNLPSDLFNQSDTATGVSATDLAAGRDFTSRLKNAGTNASTYDRYTFYRMLSQLGTDSTADDTRLNLNFNNVDVAGHIVAGAETNLIPWTNSLAFFTNAADRMLRSYTTNWFTRDPADFLATYYGFNGFYYVHDGITNDPTGFGLTNVPFFGMTNQIPAFGLTGIPVYVYSNFVYTSAINRVLQLAANIYDATTNSPYPSVFRPLFSKDTSGNIFITSYTNVDSVIGGLDPALATNYDVSFIAGLSGSFNNVADNIYGVPWIIGAKKGLPNFNEFSMVNNLQVTRRLQFTRTATNSPFSVDFKTFATNQMYLMNLSSSLGVELWNSYSNAYSGPVVIGLSENASLTITNDDPGFNQHPLGSTTIFPIGFSTNVLFATNFWTGSGAAPWYGGSPNPNSFILPLNVTVNILTNSVYRSPYAGPLALVSGLQAPCLIPTNYFAQTGTPLLFEGPSPNGFHFPQFGLVLTNHLSVFMLVPDAVSGYHVIDYVHFAGPNSSLNVNSNLADGSYAANNNDNNYQGVWNTNNYLNASPNGLTYGIWNQYVLSRSGSAPPGEDGKWQADPDAKTLGTTIPAQANAFAAFFKPGNIYNGVVNTLSNMAAPYMPTRSVVQYITWQANDPLVHYLASDVDYSSPNQGTTPAPGVHHYNVDLALSALTNLNLGSLNDRYQPWGGNPIIQGEGQTIQSDPNLYNSAERDPAMTQSDNWDFPTNQYPTVGWLGRVHRGTPWQTVYLKSTDILATNNLAIWTNWMGNPNPFDASNSAPVQDASLFDLFTTALDANATRGTLSVNQTNLAAWSALFSGLTVPTSLGNTFTNIDPVGMNGTNAALWQLVNYTTNNYAGINPTRANLNLFPQGVFPRVGDILRTPALTEQSPFLAGLVLTNNQISDALAEWLPQQTLGLLRDSSAPKYVLYAWGQTLKPAANGLVTSGGPAFFGLVTNYQVTAESAARAVISVHPHVTATATGFVTNYTTTVESYNVLPPN